jgi:two-component system response regulator FixJ
MKRIGRSAETCSEHGLAAQFPGREKLTPRECEVLALIAGGASNKEAGRRLGISPRTIEVHRAHIMDKLGAKNSLDLVHKVMAAGHP